MVKEIGDYEEGEGDKEKREGVFVPEGQRTASRWRGNRCGIGKWQFIKTKGETPC